MRNRDRDRRGDVRGLLALCATPTLYRLLLVAHEHFYDLIVAELRRRGEEA